MRLTNRRGFKIFEVIMDAVVFAFALAIILDHARAAVNAAPQFTIVGILGALMEDAIKYPWVWAPFLVVFAIWLAVKILRVVGDHRAGNAQDALEQRLLAVLERLERKLDTTSREGNDDGSPTKH